MEVHRHRIEVPTETTVIKLFPFGDSHFGALNCDWDAAHRTRAQIEADPNAYVIVMGDVYDGILPSDKRWDAAIGTAHKPRDQTDLLNDYYKMGLDFFKPIANKIIGIHKGNHEDDVERHHYTNLTRRLCADLDTAYLGYLALTRLEIDIRPQKALIRLDIFSEHGGSGGGTDGNAINQLLKRMDHIRADIFLKGHVHKRAIIRKNEMSWGPAGAITRTRLAVLTGSYLKTYEIGVTPYPERKGLALGDTGGTCILIKPVRSRITEAKFPMLDAVYLEGLGMLHSP